MLKLYKGNILYIKKSVEDESFKVNVIIYYRYSLFKFNKISFEESLSESLTLKDLMNTIKLEISKLDKICKL